MNRSNYSGRILLKLRHKKGVTQNAICTLLGLKRYQSISNVECGYIKLPAQWIPKLARFFNVSENEFLLALKRDKSSETLERMYSPQARRA